MKPVVVVIVFVSALAGAGSAQAQSRGGGGASAGAQPSAPSVSVPSSSGTTGLKGLRPSSSPKVFTLEQAFARAVQQSFDLRIATARVDEANANVTKAWSAILPQINAGANYTYSFPNQKFSLGDPKQFQQQALLFNSLGDITAASAAQIPDPNQQRAALERADQLHAAAAQIARSKVTTIQITPTNAVDGQISLTVPLFNGRAIPLLQNAYAGVDVSKMATRQARAAVVYAVARSYYGLVAGKRIVDIAEQQVKGAAAHRDLAKQRIDDGLSTPLQLQRAELDLARAEQQASSARGAVKLQKGALGALLGVVDDFDVAEPPAVPALESGKSVDDLLQRAVDGRDDLRLEKQALAIADHTKADAWWRLAPSLALSVSGRATSNTGGLVSDPFTGAVTVQASIPIYDGGLTYGTIDESDAKLREELLRVRQLEQSIEDEVRGTLDDIELKRTAVVTADRVLDLARAQKTNVEDLFSAGAATGLDVTDANLGSFSAEVDAARARFDLETARLGLAYAVGELRPNDDLSPAPLTDEEAKAARDYVESAKVKDQAAPTQPATTTTTTP